MSAVHILLMYLLAVSFDFAASEIHIPNSPFRWLFIALRLIDKEHPEQNQHVYSFYAQRSGTGTIRHGSRKQRNLC